MTEPMIAAGFASKEYTPQPGLSLQGQFYLRIATGIRDPLEAVAMALRQNNVVVVMVTLDVCVLEENFVRACQREFEQVHGIPGEHLLIHSTHTHVAPSLNNDLSFNPETGGTDPTYVSAVQRCLLETVAEALDRLEPVTLHAGCGKAEHLGWNRRAMFNDGTSKMYGNSEMSGFSGMEGPRDPDLPVMFARDRKGRITGVVFNFSSHPNSMEHGLEYSADFPGEARRTVGRILDGVPVLYLTGAAGNTAPSVLDPFDPSQPWRGEKGLIRSGQYLAEIALGVISSSPPAMMNPSLTLERTVLAIELRPWPHPEELAHPKANPLNEEVTRIYRLVEADWSERLNRQSPAKVSLNVLRVGDVVFCTNPVEFFVELGLDIKHWSTAEVTFVVELTDGYAGYAPTLKAFERGGYEVWPSPVSFLKVGAGEQIVETIRIMLDRAGCGRT